MKKPLKKAVLLDSHPYPFTIMVSVGQTAKEVNQSFEKLAGLKVTDEAAKKDFILDGAAARVVPVGVRGIEKKDHKSVAFILMFDEEYLVYPGKLAHESFHLVDQAFNTIGIELEPGGMNEHWAYLIDSYADQIAKEFILNVRRKKISKR